MSHPSPAPATPQAPAAQPRDFTKLLSASLISTLGDGALVAALPLLAQSLTKDPRLIAAVTTFNKLPWLLLALVSGALVDRLDRRRIMVRAQAAQAVLVGVLALLTSVGAIEIWMLCVLAFGLTTAEILFTTSSQAIVPSIVPADRLETANGRIIAAQSAAREFAGPPLGAALFALALPLPFWLNAITFAVSLALIARMRAGGTPPPRTGRSHLGRDILDGLRLLARYRLPLTLTLSAGAANFCEAMSLSTLVLFAHDVLHVSNAGYGILLATMAGGGVLGSLLSGRTVRRFGGLRVGIVALFVGPLVWLAIGAFGRGPVVVVALFAVFATTLAMWNVVSISTRQRVVPQEMLGRVVAAGRMVSYGAVPLGALAGGFLASSYGLVSPWVVGGLLNLLATLVTVPMLIRYWNWRPAE